MSELRDAIARSHAALAEVAQTQQRIQSTLSQSYALDRAQGVAMAELGTATVKVMPDLSDFAAALQQIGDGFTMTEDISYEFNKEGQVASQRRTVSITRNQP
jgi:hypothetical protein